MKLSYKWLSQYVDLSGISPEELADRLTTTGLEVEGMEKQASGTNLVIGEILECWNHPDSDHLHVTKTRISDTQVNQIVCGAPNCRAGLKVIVALPGAQLPGGVINPRPIRGQESNGMLCALNELGVDPKLLRPEQVAGIEELPADAPVGETDVLGYLGLDDTILDVSLTANRADCLSMWNMAEEVGAILQRKVTLPDCAGKADTGTPSDFKIAIESDKCSCYYGKVIEHVKVGPSPEWMVRYLHAYGMNSINNVVDISNFVMLETGQPLHFYDYSKLKNKSIVVKDDQEMTVKALDGVDFTIQKGDVLICDGDEFAGVAGIMGGEASMIDENTSSIFIEAAAFDHAAIRHTAIRLNLLTEAAQRFIKGVEPMAMRKAMDRSVDLLTQYAEADGLEATVKAGDENYKPLVITETLEHCNGLLGTDFTLDQVVGVLRNLHFEPEVNGTAITCKIPSYRMDMEGQADIDEEVIRILGYDSLASTLPQMKSTVGMLSEKQQLRRSIRTSAQSYGLHETMTYTLTGDKQIADSWNPVGEAIAVSSPMSDVRKYIRTSLMASLLEMAAYNDAHQNPDGGYFEISSVYGKDVSEERLAVLLMGNVEADSLRHVTVSADFYAIKGMLEGILDRCGYPAARLIWKENKTDRTHFHPYRSAELWLGKVKLGVVGELHPAYLKAYDLERVTYAEITIEPLLTSHPSKVRFSELDRYPGMSRDLAVVVKQDISAQQLVETIRHAGKKLVKDVQVFDVYAGKGVEVGYKSVALHIVYQAVDHTLTEQDVTPVQEEILKSLAKKLDAQLRG